MKTTKYGDKTTENNREKYLCAFEKHIILLPTK